MLDIKFEWSKFRIPHFFRHPVHTSGIIYIHKIYMYTRPQFRGQTPPKLKPTLIWPPKPLKRDGINHKISFRLEKHQKGT